MPGQASQFSRKAPSEYMDPDAEYSPQQLYILQAFQSQVYIQDRMDVQDEPIYDTTNFAAAAVIDQNTSAWFDDVGSRSGKTLAESNMTRSRTLIAPEAQAIFQYRVLFNEDIDARDILAIAVPGALHRSFAFVFTMGTKDYQTGPMRLYNAGAGIFAQFTTSDTAYYQNGFPTAQASQALSVNLVIENEESFVANLQGTPYTVLGTPGVHMQCLLMGLHARPIR
jgi:hypothetical protein